jgi:esterase/lipase superfamily enzyme
MYKRELRRDSNGHYKRSSSEQLWTLLIIITFLSLVGAVVYGSNSLQYYMEKWKEFTLITFLFPVIVYIILKVSILMKWILYWIIVATGILFLLDTTDLFKNNPLVAQYVFGGFVLIELITFFTYIWIQQIYPNLVLYFALGNPKQFWDIQSLSRPGFYTCKSGWGFKRRKTFYFEGDVDSLGRPDGVGKFIGEWSNSEILSGFFSDGYPMAPFKSREYRTGYTFAAVRIGFVATDAAGFKHSSFSRLERKKYGVAGVECSTSGRFFSDLPHAELILDPYKTDLSLQECLDGIVHFQDLFGPKKQTERVVVELTRNGIQIPGYRLVSTDPLARKRVQIHTNRRNGSTMTLTNREGEMPPNEELSLEIDGWVHEDRPTEVLLYIPGFNASMESAMETLGQMLTLGNLPPRIKPIIFGWPGGTLVLYAKAIKVATSYTTVDDFIQVIEELGSVGIQKVHILCHSMGSRIVTAATHRFHEVFGYEKPSTPTVEISDDTQGKVQLGSVTFINPETSLDDFCNVQYDLLRAHTPLITVYANESDIALKSAEWITFQRMLGNHVRHLSRHGDSLDLDVVDTTALDMNIHAAKHSYFNLNKYIVDDVVDVITNCKRAVDREGRLLNIESNIYCFLSAPSYVVNK